MELGSLQEIGLKLLQANGSVTGADIRRACPGTDLTRGRKSSAPIGYHTFVLCNSISRFLALSNRSAGGREARKPKTAGDAHDARNFSSLLRRILTDWAKPNRYRN